MIFKFVRRVFNSSLPKESTPIAHEKNFAFLNQREFISRNPCWNSSRRLTSVNRYRNRRSHQVLQISSDGSPRKCSCRFDEIWSGTLRNSEIHEASNFHTHCNHLLRYRQCPVRSETFEIQYPLNYYLLHIGNTGCCNLGKDFYES